MWASHPIFTWGEKMLKSEKLIFVVRERTSNSDATVILKDEKGILFCEINAHLFESGDKQITINPINEPINIIVKAKP